MDNNFLSSENRNKFINDNKNFIYSCTQKICKRCLSWENDDELSISLIAFNKACDSYKKLKGNFYSYASTLIRNSLIDYFRKSSKNPYITFDNDNEGNDYIDFKTSLSNYELECENKKRAEEIAYFSKELTEYKIGFNDLIKSSPKHTDSREHLINLAYICSTNEDIIIYIKQKKMLPVSQIILLTNEKRKFIEKWRKYIIALILLLSSSEYPYIKSYLNIKVGETYD